MVYKMSIFCYLVNQALIYKYSRLIMSNLGIRLQQARKAAGLSLRALAELVRLSHAAIKKYEDGIVYPSSDVLIKLAKA